jgi:hypothetical protein
VCMYGSYKSMGDTLHHLEFTGKGVLVFTFSKGGWDRAAKPTRSEKVEVGLIFDFWCGEKPDVYPRLD